MFTGGCHHSSSHVSGLLTYTMPALMTGIVRVVSPATVGQLSQQSPVIHPVTHNHPLHRQPYHHAFAPYTPVTNALKSCRTVSICHERKQVGISKPYQIIHPIPHQPRCQSRSDSLSHLRSSPPDWSDQVRSTQILQTVSINYGHISA